MREPTRGDTDRKYFRQLDIVHPDKLSFPITVIGAGASGSYTAFALGKMGCSDINVWDHDIVEEHNQPNQLYGAEYIGQAKAVALGIEVNRLTGILPGQMRLRYKDQLLGDSPKRVVISCVDNMEARQEIWDQVKGQSSQRNPTLFIDPRQGGEHIVIYCARTHGDVMGAKLLEENLHPSEESMELPCTAQAVIYNSMITGGLVADLVKKHALGEKLPRRLVFDLNALAMTKE